MFGLLRWIHQRTSAFECAINSRNILRPQLSVSLHLQPLRVQPWNGPRPQPRKLLQAPHVMHLLGGSNRCCNAALAREPLICVTTQSESRQRAATRQRQPNSQAAALHICSTNLANAKTSKKNQSLFGLARASQLVLGGAARNVRLGPRCRSRAFLMGHQARSTTPYAPVWCRPSCSACDSGPLSRRKVEHAVGKRRLFCFEVWSPLTRSEVVRRVRSVQQPLTMSG
mmetsp:Transcript_103314/g.296632  ORF Transcript_103314/g.296632 Transcript_103314/m.296632 type:complete len:227 (-) Transcript_103314:380-1060(-)